MSKASTKASTKASKSTKGKKSSPLGFKIERTDGGQGEVGRFDISHPSIKEPLAYTSFLRCLGALGFKYRMADALLRDAGIAEPSPNTVRSQLHSGYQGTLSTGELKKREKQKFKNTRSGGHRAGRPGHHGFADTDALKKWKSVIQRAAKYYGEKIAASK